MYYPLLLDLQKIHIAIIGMGQVGRRKLRSLLPCFPLSISIYDPNLTEETVTTLTQEIQTQGDLYSDTAIFQCNGRTKRQKQGHSKQLQTKKNVTHIYFHTKEFKDTDIHAIGLLFAATNNRKTNEYLSFLCSKNNVLCNIVDAENESNFIVPAVIRKKGITLSVATNGQSPALTRRIKSDIEQYLGNKYSALSTLLGRLRPLILIHKDSDENASLFRNIVSSPLAEYLEQGNQEAAKRELLTLLPESLHNVVGELLNDL